ncbi:MAG: FAD-binding protein, partial [Ignavibacteria bacterium]|nr:FAD-binding protein [Ignavibacteria bacterium]
FNSLSKRNCFGAFVFDIKAKAVHKFISKITVLATGGLGQVYLHTTNPSIATGDGFAIAYRAGAVIANMEFVQFHPTSLYEPEKPNKNSERSFLISEAVRGFGAKLKLRTGEEFMSKYDSRAELAPRDIVARAIDNELKRTGDSFVYLDITHKSKEQLQENFPHIYNKCLEIGIDISKDFIPVVPAAHYACGGVVTNLSGQTTIENLYAIGEVAMTGVHGANRLASNSLLEALVFAKASAEEAKNLSSKNFNPLVAEIPEWDDSGTTFAEEKVLISQNRKEIREVLWDYVGIVRSNERLSRARKRCDIIYEETAELYRKSKISEEILELRNLCEVASLIITSASKRKESRGLHYNIDYLYKDDVNWLKPTYLQNLKI